MSDDLQPLREALEEHGLWAKKSLGQHFLLDMGITRKIARQAGDLHGKAVIEVGPGPGGLTRALLEAGADPLIVIEKDARFLPLLEPLVDWSEGRLRIVEGDALEADEAELLKRFLPPQSGGSGSREARDEGGASARTDDPSRAQRPLSHASHDGSPVNGGAKLISNLPYNVGTPLLIKWLKAPAWRGPMTLMFQKEVAQRVVAKVGDDHYGRLAVLAQARCEGRIVLNVPAGAFSPPPKVASAVIHLTDRADPYPHLDVLEQVTAAAFGQRRKMLRSSLKSLTPEAEPLLERAGIAGTARAEEVDQAGFRALAEAWRESRP